VSIESSSDLRTAIAELGKHDPDPGVVTEKLLSNLTDAEAHVVVSVTLREYVRHVLSRPVVQPAADPATYKTKSGQRTASAATAALIDWYSAELSASVYVGESWKRLGDCSARDLEYLVSSRRSKAAEVLAEAERYERLLTAVTEFGVDTVASLDPEVGREVLKH
jgi:hypothetical protein